MANVESLGIAARSALERGSAASSFSSPVGSVPSVATRLRLVQPVSSSPVTLAT